MHTEPSFKTVMLWAASTVTFFTYCCSGETTVSSTYDPSVHLSLSNLVVDRVTDPIVIFLNIKQSKTDQGRIGIEVIVRYLTRRGSKPGALFICEDGSPLKFVDEVRSALTKAGLPAKDFAAHSFRIRAATTAATAGLQDSAIQTLGRWKSSAYTLYIKTAPQHLTSVSKVIIMPNMKQRT